MSQRESQSYAVNQSNHEHDAKLSLCSERVLLKMKYLLNHNHVFPYELYNEGVRSFGIFSLCLSPSISSSLDVGDD